MEHLRFENIDLKDLLLILIGVITLLLLLLMIMRRWKRKAVESFGDSRLIQPLTPLVSGFRTVFKWSMVLVSLVCIIIGLANPQIGSKMEEVKREGVDLVIALDLSNSMLAEDIKPSRLEKSKQAISKLIDRLQGDRIGLVVFGGEAFVQLPITTDYSAAKLFLATLSTDIMPTQGTAIGDAIELSMDSFGEKEKEVKNAKNKAIIVITDGENHEDDALVAAEEAANKGIVVHTIGMGLSKGAPIPIYRRGIQSGFRKDKEGNTIITKLNETMLQQIAAAGNGAYIRANNVETGLGVLFSELSKMEKVKFGSKVFSDYEDRFQYFLGLALVLLILEFFIAEKKSKWLSKLNLFNTKD